MRDVDVTTPVWRTTTERRLPAGSVIPGIDIVYVPGVGDAPVVQTPLWHAVHSPAPTASSRSPFASTASTSMSMRGFCAATHAALVGRAGFLRAPPGGLRGTVKVDLPRRRAADGRGLPRGQPLKIAGMS